MAIPFSEATLRLLDEKNYAVRVVVRLVVEKAAGYAALTNCRRGRPQHATRHSW
jgi:hypothetical protein